MAALSSEWRAVLASVQGWLGRCWCAVLCIVESAGHWAPLKSGQLRSRCASHDRGNAPGPRGPRVQRSRAARSRARARRRAFLLGFLCSVWLSLPGGGGNGEAVDLGFSMKVEVGKDTDSGSILLAEPPGRRRAGSRDGDLEDSVFIWAHTADDEGRVNINALTVPTGTACTEADDEDRMTVPTETACAEAEDGGRISTNAQDYLFTEPPGAALEDDDSRGIEDDDEELSGCEEGYLEIGRLLVGHLELQKGKTVTELDLTFWYLEQVGDNIGDEHQLFMHSRTM